MAWLEQHQQSIDVALIQETHWRNEGSRDFETGPWNVLTTGCSAKDSKAGLAVLVHKRMGRAEMLSARTLIQGRIQHVRIHQGVNSTDIINVYQHVWRSQEDRESNLKCRASVWTQLRQVTAHIPQRNTLLIGGDFNCTVRRLQRHVGSALSPVREAANDQEDFLSYLQDYGLSILNTWNARPAHTCHTGLPQLRVCSTRMQLLSRVLPGKLHLLAGGRPTIMRRCGAQFDRCTRVSSDANRKGSPHGPYSRLHCG